MYNIELSEVGDKIKIDVTDAQSGEPVMLAYADHNRDEQMIVLGQRPSFVVQGHSPSHLNKIVFEKLIENYYHYVITNTGDSHKAPLPVLSADELVQIMHIQNEVEHLQESLSEVEKKIARRGVYDTSLIYGAVARLERVNDLLHQVLGE